MNRYICINGHVYIGEWRPVCPFCGAQMNQADEFGTTPEPHQSGQEAYQSGQEAYQSGQEAYQSGQEAYQSGQEAYQSGQEAYQSGQEVYQNGFVKTGDYPPVSNEPVIKKTSGKNGNSQALIWVAFLLSLAILIVGIVFFVVSMNRVREYKETIEKQVDEMKSGSGGTYDGNGSVQVVARTKASKEGFTREYMVKDGEKITGRPTGIFEMEVRMDPEGTKLEGITWSSSDTERVKVDGNKLEILKGADEKKEDENGNVNNVVTIEGTSQDGKFTFSFSFRILHAGWIKNNRGHWYFITGSNYIVKDDWRVKKENGDSVYRYLTEEGLMDFGWIQKKESAGERAYCVDVKGDMCKNKTLTLQSNKCNFAEDGHLYSSWLIMNDKKYYYDENGIMVKDNTITIDGKSYTFDKEGLLKEQ